MAKWKKGESGNPAGRPKGARDRQKEELRAIIRDAVDPLGLVKAMEKKAKSGSEPAARLLFEYAYGRPLPSEGVGAGTGWDSAELIASAHRSLDLLPDDKLNEGLVKYLRVGPRGVLDVLDKVRLERMGKQDHEKDSKETS